MDHFVTRNRWPRPSIDGPIDYPIQDETPTCYPAPPGEAAAREPDAPTLSGSRTSFRPHAEEREPGPTPIPPEDVRKGDRLERPGSRVRFVAERGGGSSGTAYNKMDWEVLDHNHQAGRALVCRAERANAVLIAHALNRAFP